MPGIDYLNTVTKTVSYEEPNVGLAIIVVMIVCIFSILIGVLRDSSFITVIGIIIGIMLSIFISFNCSIERTKDVTGCEVIISSDINLTEFCKKYEFIGDPIINEDGQKVYFIIEK